MVFGMRWGQYESHSQSNEIIAINIVSETFELLCANARRYIIPNCKNVLNIKLQLKSSAKASEWQYQRKVQRTPLSALTSSSSTTRSSQIKNEIYYETISLLLLLLHSISDDKRFSCHFKPPVAIFIHFPPP